MIKVFGENIFLFSVPLARQFQHRYEFVRKFYRKDAMEKYCAKNNKKKREEEKTKTCERAK